MNNLSTYQCCYHGSQDHIPTSNLDAIKTKASAMLIRTKRKCESELGLLTPQSTILLYI